MQFDVMLSTFAPDQRFLTSSQTTKVTCVEAEKRNSSLLLAWLPFNDAVS